MPVIWADRDQGIPNAPVSDFVAHSHTPDELPLHSLLSRHMRRDEEYVIALCQDGVPDSIHELAKLFPGGCIYSALGGLRQAIEAPRPTSELFASLVSYRYPATNVTGLIVMPGYGFPERA